MHVALHLQTSGDVQKDGVGLCTAAQSDHTYDYLHNIIQFIA